MARRPSAERRHRKQHIKIYVQSHARAWLFLYTRDVLDSVAWLPADEALIDRIRSEFNTYLFTFR